MHAAFTGNSASYEPIGGDDGKPNRARCADDIVSPLLARGQIVFLVWVSLTEHKWVTLGERRSPPVVKPS